MMFSETPTVHQRAPVASCDSISTRVIVVVTLKGLPRVLIDGVVTRQELAPSNDPGQSTLTITGEDLSLVMDLVEKTIPYPAMPEVATLYALLAPYALFGVVPPEDTRFTSQR